MLEVKRINLSYGQMHVLKDVSLSVTKKEIVSLIGANAAGKSSVMNAISSLVPISAGKIFFESKRIDTLPSYEIIELGIIQVPEGRRIFPLMTVKDNLLMGCYNRRAREKNRESLRRVYELFPRLAERENQLGESMSGGEQQMLAVGRGLMAAPTIMMLDEPSLGLAPIVVEMIFKVLLEVNRQGTTILLVEQNVKESLDIASRAYVLENGRIVLEGPAKDLLQNAHLKKAYLGM
ncbi:MAG TPA: ABC transporter ATP-binding protein [Thermodesulfobacteriota bacterium]|nr:ABC transporter ATP-binding protein [Thermodesulfobacteriota bacterium]